MPSKEDSSKRAGIQLDDEAEAVACVAALMVAADGTATEAEVNFLFGRVANLSLFARYDAAGFRELIGTVSDRMSAAVDQNEDGSITDAGLDLVAAAVAAAVEPARWPAVMKVARAVAHSDGLEAAEQRVIDHLEKALRAKG